MIETETVAKGKTCPMTLASEQIMHCVGSDCMAWRWWQGGDRLGYCGMAGIPATAPPKGAWVGAATTALRPVQPGQA